MSPTRLAAAGKSIRKAEKASALFPWLTPFAAGRAAAGNDPPTLAARPLNKARRDRLQDDRNGSGAMAWVMPEGYAASVNDERQPPPAVSSTRRPGSIQPYMRLSR